LPANKPLEREEPDAAPAPGYTEAIDTLKAELERLRAEVASLQKTGAAQPPACVVVVANEQLTPEQGFYPVERTEDGVAFAWTGPSPKFAFDVHVDRFNGADLRLEGINFLDFEKQKNLQLQVDGHAVPAAVVKGGIGVIVTAEISPRTGNEPTHLEFVLPATLPPASAADARQLGLAFFRLTVTARA
jgi:hypothetical protein